MSDQEQAPHYQLHDPFAEATYRFDAAAAAIAKAEELGAVAFQQVGIDGKYQQHVRRDDAGHWRADDGTALSSQPAPAPAPAPEPAPAAPAPAEPPASPPGIAGFNPSDMAIGETIIYSTADQPDRLKTGTLRMTHDLPSGGQALEVERPDGQRVPVEIGRAAEPGRTLTMIAGHGRHPWPDDAGKLLVAGVDGSGQLTADESKAETWALIRHDESGNAERVGQYLDRAHAEAQRDAWAGLDDVKAHDKRINTAPPVVDPPQPGKDKEDQNKQQTVQVSGVAALLALWQSRQHAAQMTSPQADPLANTRRMEAHLDAASRDMAELAAHPAMREMARLGQLVKDEPDAADFHRQMVKQRWTANPDLGEKVAAIRSQVEHASRYAKAAQQEPGGGETAKKKASALAEDVKKLSLADMASGNGLSDSMKALWQAITGPSQQQAQNTPAPAMGRRP